MTKVGENNGRVCGNNDSIKVDVLIPTTGESSLDFSLWAIEKSMSVKHIILVGPEDLRSRFKDWENVIIVVSYVKNVGRKRFLGLEYVTTEYYASIDSDVIVNEKWFRWCIQTIVKDRVGACEGIAIDIGKHIRRVYQQDIKHGKSWLGLGATMLRTDIVRRVGMPEKKYAEDKELRHRIISNGYKWIFNPNVTCQHLVTDVMFLRHQARWGEVGGKDSFELTTWLRRVGGLLTKGLLKYKLSDCIFLCTAEFFLLYGHLKGMIKGIS